jgi:hypothetical protein
MIQRAVRESPQTQPAARRRLASCWWILHENPVDLHDPCPMIDVFAGALASLLLVEYEGVGFSERLPL